MKHWSTWWAIGGVAALLAESVFRLGHIALSSISEIDGALHVTVLVVWSLVIVYAEGHRAFHRRFCPLTVSRARALPGLNRPWLQLLAPAYAMGLVHATRRRLVVSWAVVAGVVALVVGIRQFVAPWRGIVDAGVALALAYGTASLALHAIRACRGRAPTVDPELPAADPVGGLGVASRRPA